MQANTANMNPEHFGVYGTDDEGNCTISYTRRLKHPVEKVWRAITIAEHRNAWFPELTLAANIDGEAIINFSGGDCPPPEDNPDDVYFCKVTVFDPPSVLEYVGPGEFHRFELTAEGEGCVLRFKTTLPELEKFDDDANTIQARFSVACGWHYLLDKLEWSLEGLSFEDEGYAGPVKTEYYFGYVRLSKGRSPVKSA